MSKPRKFTSRKATKRLAFEFFEGVADFVAEDGVFAAVLEGRVGGEVDRLVGERPPLLAEEDEDGEVVLLGVGAEPLDGPDDVALGGGFYRCCARRRPGCRAAA